MFVSTFILPVIMQYKELQRLQMTRLWNEQQRIQISISFQGKPAPRLTQPPIHCVLGTLSPGLKQQQGSKATLSSPSTLNVKNVYSYASTPPICLHGMHKDFTSLSTFTCTKLLSVSSCLSVQIHQVNPTTQIFIKYHIQDCYYNLKTYS